MTPELKGKNEDDNEGNGVNEGDDTSYKMVSAAAISGSRSVGKGVGEDSFQ